MRKVLWLILVLGASLTMGFRGGSCQRPLPWQIQRCGAMEEAILDATVRIVFHGAVEVDDRYGAERINGGISHATVLDGRYLLTHNHFGILLGQASLYNRFANRGFSGVSVYRLDGTAVLDQAPLDSFRVVVESEESLLLDFGSVAGEGFFTHAGIGSAQAVVGDAVGLYPGAEVAQIDWDGHSATQVVWTRVQTVYREAGLPLLQVDNFIELGASGGGVFFQGKLVGNNWARIVETEKDTGVVKRRITLVALNS